MLISIVACKKKEQTTSPSSTSTTFSFTGLSAASTTIAIGATTQVTATATGNGLSYTWSVSAGDIIGSGSQITYGAPPCCGGKNAITCIVKDANGNTQTKSVTIVVH